MGFTSGASDMLPSIPPSIADLDIGIEKFFKVVLRCLRHATVGTTIVHHALLTLILYLTFSKLSSAASDMLPLIPPCIHC